MADSTKYQIEIAASQRGLESAAAAVKSLSEKLTGASAAYQANEVAALRAQTAAQSYGDKIAAAAAKVRAASESGSVGRHDAAVASLTRLQAASDVAAAKSIALASALAAEGTAVEALKAKVEAATAAEKALTDAKASLEQASAFAAKDQQHRADAEYAAAVRLSQAEDKKAAKEEAYAKKTGEAAWNQQKAMGAFAKKTEALQSGSMNANELAEAMGRMGGPIGVAGQRVFGMVDGLKKMGGSVGVAAAGVAALVVVVVALAAAVVAGVVAIARWGVGLADAARNSALATIGLSKTSESLAQIGLALPVVARETGLAQDKLRDFAKQLAAAKVSAEDMPYALRAMALAEQGGGSAATAELVKQLQGGTKSAKELAAQMDKTFGGIVQKKLLSLDAQAERLKSNLGETFGGLKIEPFLKNLRMLISLTDTETAGGRFLKKAFEGIFQPLLDAAVVALPQIALLLIGVAIGALKVYIAFKPAIKAVKQLFGDTDTSALPSALKVGEIAGFALALALTTVVAILGLFITPIVLIIKSLAWLKESVQADFGYVVAQIASALDAIGAIDLYEAGKNIILGFVKAIIENVPAVVQAMQGVATAVTSTIDTALKMGSPSKLMEQRGAWTAQGFTGGVEDESGAAQDSLRTMVAPPDSAAPHGGASGSSQSFAGAIFNFYGVKDAADAASHFAAAMARVFEGDATMLGEPT